MTPRHLLVGPKQETVAGQVLAALAAAEVDQVNPFSGELSLAVEPHTTDLSWRIVADPTEAPVIGPQVTSRDGWDVLGLEVRCILDFGAGISDWRGAYLNAGA